MENIKQEETMSDDVRRRSPCEIELENQIKLLEEIKEKIQNKIDCEHVWKKLFINRPRVCVRCGDYENE